MITVRTSPQYVNRVRQDWTANGGVYGDGGVYAVVPSNDPFAQFGPTLDLAFAGVPTDPLNAATLTDYTLNTNFILPEYQVAAQYAIWESGTGLASKNFSDIVTFTRASTATYFDSAGVLQSAAINTARFDYDPSTLALRGLLIEEQRTNSIRNNTMQGAVAGTPGTAPTGWFISTAAGITRELVGTGTENGITYIDYRFSGTATGTSDTQFIAGNLTPAASGQSWTVSNYAKIVAGSLTNVTVTQLNNEYDGSGAFLAASAQNITPTTAGLGTQRFALTRTFNNASTANAGFVLRLASAGAIDITLRIGLPQLELGAFATSVIPTTTTALTRSADVASVNTLSPWFNATEGTLYVQAQDMSDAAHATSQPRAVSINNGTTSNTIDISRLPASAQGRARVDDTGVNQFNSLNSAWLLATQAKVALAYKANDFAACLGGGAVFTDNTGTIPTVNALTIGNVTTGGSNSWVGWIQRLTYYPRRLANADLQTLTA